MHALGTGQWYVSFAAGETDGQTVESEEVARALGGSQCALQCTATEQRSNGEKARWRSRKWERANDKWMLLVGSRSSCSLSLSVSLSGGWVAENEQTMNGEK